MRILFLLLMLSAFVLSATAMIRTESLDYTHNGVALQGYLVYDDAKSGKMPGVLVW